MASLLWGAVATYCFFRAWLGFLGVVACLIGLMCNPACHRRILEFFYRQATGMLFHGLTLALVFVVFWRELHLGRTPAETLAFLATASAVMLVILPRLPSHIDHIWKSTVERD